jgi:hypothetical protein
VHASQALILSSGPLGSNCINVSSPNCINPSGCAEVVRKVCNAPSDTPNGQTGDTIKQGPGVVQTAHPGCQRDSCVLNVNMCVTITSTTAKKTQNPRIAENMCLDAVARPSCVLMRFISPSPPLAHHPDASTDGLLPTSMWFQNPSRKYTMSQIRPPW